jgi:hypothetical protein
MKVKELIEILKNMDEELPVRIWDGDYAQSVDDVEILSEGFRKYVVIS